MFPEPLTHWIFTPPAQISRVLFPDSITLLFEADAASGCLSRNTYHAPSPAMSTVVVSIYRMYVIRCMALSGNISFAERMSSLTVLSTDSPIESCFISESPPLCPSDTVGIILSVDCSVSIPTTIFFGKRRLNFSSHTRLLNHASRSSGGFTVSATLRISATS